MIGSLGEIRTMAAVEPFCAILRNYVTLKPYAQLVETLYCLVYQIGRVYRGAGPVRIEPPW